MSVFHRAQHRSQANGRRARTRLDDNSLYNNTARARTTHAKKTTQSTAQPNRSTGRRPMRSEMVPAIGLQKNWQRP